MSTNAPFEEEGRPRVGHFRPNWPGGEAPVNGGATFNDLKIYLNDDLFERRRSPSARIIRSLAAALSPPARDNTWNLLAGAWLTSPPSLGRTGLPVVFQLSFNNDRVICNWGDEGETCSFSLSLVLVASSRLGIYQSRKERWSFSTNIVLSMNSSKLIFFVFFRTLHHGIVYRILLNEGELLHGLFYSSIIPQLSIIRFWVEKRRKKKRKRKFFWQVVIYARLDARVDRDQASGLSRKRYFSRRFGEWKNIF